MATRGDRTAREEILVLLYRALDPEQRNRLIRNLRALVDANRVSARVSGTGRTRVVADARIEAAFGLPAPARPRKATTRPPGRDPGAPLDDALGPG